MDIVVTLGIIGLISVFGVLLPVGLTVFEEFSKPEEVICPENGEPALITADAAYIAIRSMAGMNRFRLAGCSRWPDRRNCTRSCVHQLAH
jgi:hypothetical protein